MERTKFKNWKDTLLEVQKLCSFHHLELDSLLEEKEKRPMHDEYYFFKNGIKKAYQQEGYEESWIELLLKMIDVRIYRTDDFEIAEQSESYREFENKMKYGENFIKYSKMYEFDKDDVTGSEKISDRFSFNSLDLELYSYNQAIRAFGNMLLVLKNHNIEITAYTDEDSEIETLYEGDDAFNWFINQDADYFRSFYLFSISDKTQSSTYRTERIDCGFFSSLRYVYKFVII